MKEIDTLIRAAYPLIYIVTYEEKRVEAFIKDVASERNRQFLTWSCINGVVRNNTSNEDIKDPLAALDYVSGSREPAVFAFMDLHPFMDDHIIVRKLRELADTLKPQSKTLIIVSPILKLPFELEKQVTVIDWSLPGKDDIEQQGFGFVGINSKSIDTYRAINEKEIMGYLNAKQYSEVLFHHRNPTSTGNTLKSTHPFVINLNRKSYYFVHNGIVQNDAELQEEHIKRKISYKSQEGGLFNDSEALAWDFCLWISGRQKKMQAKGTAAFVCLETDEGKGNRAVKLYFYRNAEAPLRVYRDDSLLVISSEGNYPPLKENCLCCWDYGSRQALKIDELKIACPSVYDVCMDDEILNYEVALYGELQDLKQERDYLISVGNYEEADYIQEQIIDLTYQLKSRTLTPF